MNAVKPIGYGLLIYTMALVAACTAPPQTTLPDGSVAYLIECDGTTGGLNYCFERAGKSCGAAGYTIVGRDGRTLLTSDAIDSDTEAQVRAYETDQNSLLVRCGS